VCSAGGPNIRGLSVQQSLFNASEVLIEDKASGTQLIQELINDTLLAQRQVTGSRRA